MKKLFGFFAALFIAVASVQAQVQTIVVPPNAAVSSNGLYVGGTLTISSNNFACLKSLVGSAPFLQINVQGLTLTLPQSILAASPLVVAGLATIQIQQASGSPPGSFATFSVEPAPYPPDKAVTVGAYAGNVQVTMQMSTDLVNWTTATNGLTSFSER